MMHENVWNQLDIIYVTKWGIRRLKRRQAEKGKRM